MIQIEWFTEVWSPESKPMWEPSGAFGSAIIILPTEAIYLTKSRDSDSILEDTFRQHMSMAVGLAVWINGEDKWDVLYLDEDGETQTFESEHLCSFDVAEEFREFRNEAV